MSYMNKRAPRRKRQLSDRFAALALARNPSIEDKEVMNLANWRLETP